MGNLLFGLSTAAIGMLVVFVGLLILICCIVLLSKVSREKVKKKAPAQQPHQTEPVPVLPEPVQEIREEEDQALIAVITAAVAAVWDREETSFRVSRVRRVENAPAWQRSGREDQLLNHY